MLRKATLSDLPALADLWEALQQESMAADERFVLSKDAKQRISNDFPLWLKSEECLFLVAEQDTKIVGYIAAFIWIPEPLYLQVDEIFIRDLYILPHYRNQGIGKALFLQVETWGKSLGIDSIRLGALSKNKSGLEFWQKLGFSPFLSYLSKSS